MVLIQLPEIDANKLLDNETIRFLAAQQDALGSLKFVIYLGFILFALAMLGIGLLAWRQGNTKSKHNNSVSGKLDKIVTGIITNTTNIGVHEKAIGKIEIAQDENEKEIRAIDKIVTELASSIRQFVRAMEEIPTLKANYNSLEPRVTKLEETQSDIQSKLK